MAANFEVVELSESQPGVWDELLSASEQATIFCSREFSQALFAATDQAYRFLVCFRGDSVVAGLPVFRVNRGGIRLAQQPPLVPHLGLLLPGSATGAHVRTVEFNVEQAVGALSKWLAGRFDYVSLSHHPSLIDVRPFTWQSYRAQTCYTYRIDLAGFSMESVHSSVRKQVAKGEKEGLRAEPSEDLRPLQKLVSMSYERHGRKAPFGETYLATLFRELSRTGNATLWYARDRRERILSGRVLLKSGDVIYDWVAGADPSHYESGATPFLLYHLINRFKEGHRVFDLMGANTPTIAVFKSNFGGAITPYHLTTRTTSVRGALALFCHGVLGRWGKR